MTLDYSNKTILVLDDQKSFLAVLKSMLVSLGAKHVTACHNCEAALTLCAENTFDIIICDLHFGENRKNGFEFLEEVKQKRFIAPHTIFMLMSADAQRPMVLGSIEKFPDEYIVKPFSRALLDSRINRQHKQKQALLEVYTHIHQADLENAILACKLIMQQVSRYRDICLKILIKLLWQTHQYREAHQLLNALPQSSTNHWLNVSRAQTELLLGNYQEAISIAKSVIVRNTLFVDAHDIISSAYLASGKKREAFYAIENALSVSPHSLKRNLLACEIARENAEQSNLVNYTKQIWDLTKHTSNFDIAHLCSHIRSHLDYAEHVHNKESKTRIQQNALKSLNSLAQQSNTKLKQVDFDPSIYAELVESRVDFQNQQWLTSKQKLGRVQQRLSEKYGDCPMSMIPDSVKAMYDHQEFDEAQQLLEKYQDACTNRDPNTEASLKRFSTDILETKNQYIQYNTKGIQLFDKGQFKSALVAFEQAQQVAPHNSAIALNLLKCQLKLIELSNAPNQPLLQACRNNYQQIANMPKLVNHALAFEDMKPLARQQLQLR